MEERPATSTTSTRRRTGALVQEVRLGSDDDDQEEEEEEEETRAQNNCLEMKKRTMGLKDFASVVCAKVQSLGTTTYNEVIELMIEEIASKNESHDERNIRRRICDVLNVFIAIDLIRKDGKSISWQNSHRNPLPEVKEKPESLKRKQEELDDILSQNEQLRKLARRNADQATTPTTPDEVHTHLPFLALVTSAKTSLSCEVTEDKSQIALDLSRPFELYDQTHILNCILKD